MINSSFIAKLKNSYDIRSNRMNGNDVFFIGRSFGSEVLKSGERKIVVGYDRRKNSALFADSFIEGVLCSGCDVIHIGPASTPMVQMAEFALSAGASVSVTASHNPSDYHGFKFFLKGKAFAGENLVSLMKKIQLKDFLHGKGVLQYRNFMSDYVFYLRRGLPINGKFKIGWDLVRGVGGDIFPHLVQDLRGVHCVTNHMYDPEFNGFPPDPSYEPRLDEIKQMVREEKLDFAFILDGDADRCVLMDSNSRLISGDVLLALYSYLTHKLSGDKLRVVWDSKSSQALINWVKSFSENCFISPTGHSNLTSVMDRNSAQIGGEVSGHYMFTDRYFGISDGFYAALRFISDLETTEISFQEILNMLPSVWTAEMLNIECSEDRKESIIEEIREHLLREGVTVDMKDGVKACCSSGWWMVRPSRTEPLLRISAEGWTEAGLENVQEHLSTVLSVIGIK